MIELETTIKRICPGIVDGEGRELQVTLTPADGGTIIISWKGIRKESEVDLPLRDLMRYAEKKPKAKTDPEAPKAPKGKIDKREWCSYEDLLSQVHILSGVDSKERESLVKLVKDLRMYNEWLEVTTGISWENFKNKQKGDEHAKDTE